MTSNVDQWREITVNVILSTVLTLKLSGLANSINFLDYFWGMALFTFFCANFNTEKDSLKDAKACHKVAGKIGDLIEYGEC